jgi:hypothetical protein
MRLTLLAAAAALCFAAAPAFADSASIVKTEPSQFPSTKAQIEKDLKEGKRYSELSRTQRDEVVAALERIEHALSGISDVSELSPGDRAQLMTDQELVNTRLTKAADDSRLICKQERKTGSHRPTTQCRTVAQMKQQRDDAEMIGRRVQRPPRMKSSGGN